MAKSIIVVLEEVSVYHTTPPSVVFRATIRHRGTTLAFSEGNNPKEVLLKAMKEGVGGHQLPDGSFDLTHIELNERAKKFL